MEHVYLVGSEAVQQAASGMRAAAEQMARAASHMESALSAHERFMDQWLLRLASVLGTEVEAGP